jgi:hypothetical protein
MRGKGRAFWTSVAWQRGQVTLPAHARKESGHEPATSRKVIADG